MSDPLDDQQVNSIRKCSKANVKRFMGMYVEGAADSRCCCGHKWGGHQFYSIKYTSPAHAVASTGGQLIEYKGDVALECLVRKCSCLAFETDNLNWYVRRAQVEEWKKIL